jgi:hypothetical protein
MIATASNGEVEHEDSQREDITPNVVSHWIWTSKKASTYSSFLSKSAIETFSEIRRHERMEDLRGVPEWHDDLSALCSAVMIGHRD